MKESETDIPVVGRTTKVTCKTSSNSSTGSTSGIDRVDTSTGESKFYVPINTGSLSNAPKNDRTVIIVKGADFAVMQLLLILPVLPILLHR